ncbi:glycosyl transferase [Flavivirga aquatica]|uniref:Glycosyl transferase n=1 Tax=Flavivirga aquatica TaxID=1849968 RepID=A0A1E5TAT7_9FLAO|nr:glycosyltransferase [Flavivirga aquatica]OEK08458.1 glycosyl transferase [Flavivirga aquatica]
MKILQIINSLDTGGAEKLILETIPLFNKRNVQTDLAVLNGFDYPFLKILKKLNCCSIFSLGNKSVYNPFLIFKIRPLLKNYDIVHVHIFPSLYWVALAKMLSFSKVKLVYTEHSTSNNRRKRFIFKILDKFIYSFYSKIITISPEVDTNIKAHLKYNNDKFVLVQNGINLDTIKNEKPISKKELLPNLENDSYILTQVSSFRYPKDQKTVIKSLKKLNDNVVLVLIGDGPLRNECEVLVEELNLSKRVFFLGIRMDVINILKASDIIILSSHHEGLSLSSVEGMASEKPFIASDAPGLGDIVRNAGILFPINDDSSLAKEISKLLENSEHYQETVTKCLKRANDYSIDKTITKEINLYKSLLEK